MRRREMFKNAGLLAGAWGLSTAGATEAFAQAKSGKSAAGAAKPLDTALLAQLSDECVRTAEACITHCQSLMAKGDTSVAGCLKKSLDVATVCRTTATLARYESPLTPAQARVTLAACEACAAECKSHAHHHASCKAMAESCQKCADECRKVSG